MQEKSSMEPENWQDLPKGLRFDTLLFVFSLPGIFVGTGKKSNIPFR
jgi:hypothetical protein